MRWPLILALALAAGCLQGVELEKQVFACRGPADCIEGFVCHPTRFVCVAVGTATVSDAGARDADAPDAPAAPGRDAALGDATPRDALPADGPRLDDGALPPSLGERCTPAVGCAEGFCVDGVCCKEPCDGTCEQCDLTPGECTPVTRGRDPAAECADLDCATLTYGLEGNTCYAYRDETRASTCDGAGACSVPVCTDAARGRVLASCIDVVCIAPGACAANRPAVDFDSAAKLCGGPDQTCNLANTAEACCSPAGRCCPALVCAGPSSERCP